MKWRRKSGVGFGPRLGGGNDQTLNTVSLYGAGIQRQHEELYELENRYLNCVIDRQREFQSASRRCTFLSASGSVFRFIGFGCGHFLVKVDRIAQSLRRLFRRGAEFLTEKKCRRVLTEAGYGSTDAGDSVRAILFSRVIKNLFWPSMPNSTTPLRRAA